MLPKTTIVFLTAAALTRVMTADAFARGGGGGGHGGGFGGGGQMGDRVGGGTRMGGGFGGGRKTSNANGRNPHRAPSFT